MNLFSVEFKNQPGELADLGDVCAQRGVNLQRAKFGRKLADAGVNIQSLLEVSICQGEMIFAITVDKPEDARAALSDQIVG